MEISKVIILPKPQSQREAQLFEQLETFYRNITTALDKGLNFTDNIDCDLVDYSTNAVADTEDTLTHKLGKTPTGYIPYYLDKAAIIYDSGTSWTSDNIYLKCDTASVSAKLIIF